MRVNNRIVCAANRDPKTATIVIGIRHFDDLMRNQMQRIPGPNWSTSEQGFIDQHGNFLTREQARQIAAREGQILRRVGGDEHRLYSENLY